MRNLSQFRAYCLVRLLLVCLVSVALTAPGSAFANKILTFSLATTPSPALAGEDLTATIDWSHSGGNCSSGTLRLGFPASGVTFKNASSGGVPSAGAVEWFFPATHGGSRGGSFYANFVVDPALPPGTDLSFTLSLTGSDCAVNAPPSTTIPAEPAAVLVLTKQASATTVSAGGSVSYTLSYENTGNTDATGVVLSDTLPAGLQFESATGNGQHSAGIVTWNLGTLAQGASGSVTYQARVTASSGTLTNSAEIAADNSAPASASADVRVAQQPELVITKTAADVVESGGQITYTIGYENRGNAAATDVTVVDTFAPNATPLVIVNGSPGAGTITWNLGTLGAGATGNLTYSALVDSGLPDGELIENTVQISSSNAPSASATHQAYTSSDPRLQLEKVGPVTAPAGGTVLYVLNFRNTGLGDATNVVLEDALPTDCLVRDAGGATFDGATGKWRWSLGTLAGGSGGSVFISCTVDPGVTIGKQLTNNADLNADGVPPVTDQAVTLIRSGAILEVEKTVTPSQVEAGGTLTYLIEVRNVGSGRATGVTLADDLDVNTTFSSASAGGSESGGTVTWDLGVLEPGAGTSRSLVVDVLSPLGNGTQILNAATADSAETTPLTSNAVRATVNSAPLLLIGKSPSASPVAAGDPLTYTLNAVNLGNANATDVILTEVLPQYVTFGSATAGGTESGGTVRWDLGTLPAGASVSAILTVDVANGLQNGTPLLNAVTLDSAETNETAARLLVPVTSETRFQLDKTASADPVRAGQTLKYAIAYTNVGNQDATNGLLVDSLPDNVQFVAASPGGVFDASTRSVAWDLGTVRAGQSGSAELTVAVDNPLPNGTALVNSVLLDSTQASATTQLTTRVSSFPQLQIEKVASPVGNVEAGKQVAYTLRYANLGTDTAVAVQLTDTLPREITDPPVFVSGGGSYDAAPRTVTWNLGDLPAGDSGTRDLVVQVPVGIADGTSLVNSAALTANNGNATSAVFTNTVGSAPRLRTELVVDRTIVPAGSVLTYTVGVQNTGNAGATGVVVEVPIPANTTYVLDSVGAGVSGGKVTFSAGDLPPGVGRTFLLLTLIADPLANGTSIFASATASAANAPSNSANTATQVTSAPVLTLTKNAQSQVIAGEQLLYALELRNTGSDAATNVVLQDRLPADTRFASASAGGTENSGLVTWDLGTLSAGGGTTVFVLVDVDSPLPNGTDLVNKASLDSIETAVVSASANTTVTSAPLLRVEKAASPSPVASGETALFTLEYFNDGNDTARNARLVDRLPAGGFPVIITDNGVYDSGAGTVTWSLGDIPAGAGGERFLTVLFPTGLDDGLVLSNGATLSAANAPSASVQIPVLIGSAPQLRIDLLVDQSVAPAGGKLEYIVDIQNIGNGDALSPVVQLPLPANTSYLSDSEGAGASNGLVSWSIADLPPGAGRNLRLVVAIDAPLADGTQITATVTASAANASSVSDQVATLVTSAPILNVSKTAAPAAVKPGDRLVYTIAFENLGSTSATGATVIDVLDDTVSFASADQGGTYDPAGHRVTWVLPDPLASGARGTLTLEVDVNVPAGGTGDIVNFVEILSNETAPATDSVTTGLTVTPISAIPTLSTTLLGLLAMLMIVLAWRYLSRTSSARMPVR